MLPSEPGLRVSIGVSGSGKSYGQRQEILSAAPTIPVLIMDAMREWVSVPNEHAPHTAGANDIATAKRLFDSGKRLVIVQPTDGTLIQQAAQAAEWARLYPGVAGLVFPEAHHIAPVAGPVPIEVDRIATQWRHHKVAMWADTQRIARLNHAITDNAFILRLYAQIGDLDLKRVKEIGGAPLVEAINECARLYAPLDEGGAGEPGWHVRLGLRRIPPFPIVRS